MTPAPIALRILRRAYRCLGSTKRATKPALRPAGSLPPPALGLGWMYNNESPGGGIRIHAQSEAAYPEVTGYIVPTLVNYGARDLAGRCLEWLLSVQQPDGSFLEPDCGKKFIFDTGQALRGLLAMSDDEPAAEEAARKAAVYLQREMEVGGTNGFGPRYNELWTEIPEPIHLYVLPPLLTAAERFGLPDLRQGCLSCLEHYLHHPEALRLADLTHFLAYQLEALIDHGQPERASPVLERLAELQQKDGAVRGREGVRWVCTPGLLQLAICWYKVGWHEPADLAVEWAERHQLASGGFIGSYGNGASYFADREISWAVKYYLDAHRLRLESFFDRHAGEFPDTVAEEDGRLAALAALIHEGDSIVDVGCGKGRFLKALAVSHRSLSCTGVDLSRKMLESLPPGMSAVQGSLEHVPLASDAFDVSFSVEAVEHSPNVAAAVRELVRLCKPGGRVAIVDKHIGHWGRLECPSWERWPSKDALADALRAAGCDEIGVEAVGHDDTPASESIMAIWTARKTCSGTC